jgi:hypothetical protein
MSSKNPCMQCLPRDLMFVFVYFVILWKNSTLLLELIRLGTRGACSVVALEAWLIVLSTEQAERVPSHLNRLIPA